MIWRKEDVSFTGRVAMTDSQSTITLENVIEWRMTADYRDTKSD